MDYKEEVGRIGKIRGRIFYIRGDNITELFKILLLYYLFISLFPYTLL